MGRKNKVIAGDYVGKDVMCTFGTVTISTSFTKGIGLSKENIEAYEVITDEHRKSAKSGAVRGLVGATLLGPVGLVAGGLSAKSKGLYQVALQFRDGKRSLIEVDDKIYKAIIKNCF